MLLFVAGGFSFRQAAAQTETGLLTFPANPAQWINAPPISTEMLKGKGAFLYFFEEDCPRCESAWPDLLKSAKEFDGQPVLFIGVNSGSARGDIEAYARRNNITWPIILDTDRSIEKVAGVGEISLQNIYQVRLLTATGSLIPGSWSDVPGSAQKALAGASWKVDPAGISPTMRGAWAAVEFGTYSQAAIDINKGLRSPKEEIKVSAEKLNTFIQEALKRELTTAEALRSQGEVWPAYKIVATAQEQFKGYAIPEGLTTLAKELEADEKIAGELAAMKALDLIRRALGSSSAAAQRRALKQLETLVAEHPGTEAAAQASTILAQAAGAGG